MTDKKESNPEQKRTRRVLTYEEWADRFAESNHKESMKPYLNAMKIDCQKTIDD